MSSILIRNLPDNISEEKIMEKFSEYGSCSVIKAGKECQISFTDKKAGIEAMENENGKNGLVIKLLSGLGGGKFKKGIKKYQEKKSDELKNTDELIIFPHKTKTICYARKTAPVINIKGDAIKRLIKSLKP